MARVPGAPVAPVPGDEQEATAHGDGRLGQGARHLVTEEARDDDDGDADAEQPLYVAAPVHLPAARHGEEGRGQDEHRKYGMEPGMDVVEDRPQRQKRECNREHQTMHEADAGKAHADAIPQVRSAFVGEGGGRHWISSSVY